MSSRFEEVLDAVPRWVWMAAAGTAIGTVGGLVFASLRPPHPNTLVQRTGAPEAIEVLAALQRFTESRGNPRTGLGRMELFPSWAEPRRAPRAQQVAESEAALEAYERNREAYAKSPFPQRMWIFGSGGYYGLIPGNALGPFRNTDPLRQGKVGPYDVFDPWRSTALFVDYLWRIVQRDEFRAMPAQHRTVLALKRSLARPSLAWDYQETYERSQISRRNAEKAARALRLPDSALYRRIPLDWPDYPGVRELLP